MVKTNKGKALREVRAIDKNWSIDWNKSMEENALNIPFKILRMGKRTIKKVAEERY